MEPFGALTQGIDWALIVLYVFWLFFFALVFYLLREGRREGYPLVDDMTGRRENGGVIWIPSPKKFVTDHGVYYAPRRDEVEPDIGPDRAVPASPFPGAPLVPVGDPLVAAVGPASFVLREDRPDLTSEDDIKLRPMRMLPEHEIAEFDADPRGFEVVGADGVPVGTVEDLWIDRSEMMVRYFEVRLDPEIAAAATVEPHEGVEVAAVAVAADTTGDGEVDTAAVAATAEPAVVEAPVTHAIETVLMPMNTATLSPMYGQISTPSILGAQFANVPRLKSPDQITLLEEDKIMAYFAGGELYATPARSEPLL